MKISKQQDKTVTQLAFDFVEKAKQEECDIFYSLGNYNLGEKFYALNIVNDREGRKSVYFTTWIFCHQ